MCREKFNLIDNALVNIINGVFLILLTKECLANKNGTLRHWHRMSLAEQLRGQDKHDTLRGNRTSKKLKKNTI